MSGKPPKKSDLGKSWMKPRRDSPKKLQPEYHLIVTEGTKTEPAYFQAMKDIINQNHRERVQLNISGEGQNTLNLLDRAVKLAEGNANRYRHVWVVYDIDDFPAEHIDETARLCGIYSTEETEFHAIWSNQCIELWFLLHFCYWQSDVHRNLYFKPLSENLKRIKAGEYKKNRTDIYDVLRPYMDTAIMNAEKLAYDNKGKNPSEAAPGTKMNVLIKKLKPYL